MPSLTERATSCWIASLVQQKKALFASKENIKQVEKIKAELNKKDLEKKKSAKIVMEKINNKKRTIDVLRSEYLQQFLDDIQGIVTNWILKSGFSVGIGDLVPDQSSQNKMHQLNKALTVFQILSTAG